MAQIYFPKPNISANIKPHLIRYSVLLGYILLVTHFINYREIPFSANYVFPWFTFIAMTLFSIPICTANWFVFKKIKPQKTLGYAQKILSQVGINAAFTLGIYAILFWLMNIVILKGEFSLFIFLKYFLVCLTLVITEVGVLSAFELYREKETALIRPENYLPSKLIFGTGKKIIQISVDEIKVLHSSNGIISIYLEGRKYTSDFNSLEEILPDLPKDQFFQVSRQVIVHRKVIREVKKETNRKLSILIDPQIMKSPLITVSRYRSKEFKNWF